MLIRYANGRVAFAALTRASRNGMRAAVARGNASAAFRCVDGRWLSISDGPVEIDFTAATTEREWHRFCESLAGLDDYSPWNAESLLAGCAPLPPARGHVPARRVSRPGRCKTKPFAIQLYERFSSGETIEQLASALDIPIERIAARIRAAERHMRERDGNAA